MSGWQACEQDCRYTEKGNQQSIELSPISITLSCRAADSEGRDGPMTCPGGTGKRYVGDISIWWNVNRLLLGSSLKGQVVFYNMPGCVMLASS